MLRQKAAGKLELHQYEIGRLHGVSAATVSYLKNGGRWDWLSHGRQASGRR